MDVKVSNHAAEQASEELRHIRDEMGLDSSGFWKLLWQSENGQLSVLKLDRSFSFFEQCLRGEHPAPIINSFVRFAKSLLAQA